MTADDISTVSIPATTCQRAESEKNSLEELRTELYGASKDVQGSYKRYARAKSKMNEKSSPRNLARLSKAEQELGMFIEGYDAAYKRVQQTLSSLVKVHGNYVGELYLSGDSASAKKASRAMDSYVKKVERFIQRVADSVACISSHYELCIRASGGEKDELVSQKSAYDGEKMLPSTSYVHTNEVAVTPVSIDIGPTVERAVERAISELSDALERRIAEALNALELPTVSDTSALSDAANRLNLLSAYAGELVERLDKLVSDTERMAERCQRIVEMQRATARELQGIEVKQRLVNQELSEAQDALNTEKSTPADKNGKKAKESEEKNDG